MSQCAHDFGRPAPQCNAAVFERRSANSPSMVTIDRAILLVGEGSSVREARLRGGSCWLCDDQRTSGLMKQGEVLAFIQPSGPTCMALMLHLHSTGVAPVTQWHTRRRPAQQLPPEPRHGLPDASRAVPLCCDGRPGAPWYLHGRDSLFGGLAGNSAGKGLIERDEQERVVPCPPRPNSDPHPHRSHHVHRRHHVHRHACRHAVMQLHTPDGAAARAGRRSC